MSTEYIKQPFNKNTGDSKLNAQEGESFKSFISSTSEEGDFHAKRTETNFLGNVSEQLPYDLEGESLW
ncbi:hypothetical protein [Segetibacter aerophilus]|nr:hypothetical protein [Segetibacter aerophilus]